MDPSVMQQAMAAMVSGAFYGPQSYAFRLNVASIIRSLNVLCAAEADEPGTGTIALSPFLDGLYQQARED